MQEKNWDIIIKPSKGFVKINLKELIKYKDLIILLVKRDFVTFYKQTILGPLWYILQPLINTIVFTIIFGNLAKIPTDNLPPFLFYMAGNIIWGYFAFCLNSTSTTFVKNADIFGKVYFPRITVPISTVIIGLFQFILQLIFFICFYIYFVSKGLDIKISYSILFLPLILLQTALVALGFGLLISSLTSKYRDLVFVLGFGIQLWMFATPIVYPLSIIPDNYVIFSILNPMTSIVECFRYILFNESSIKFAHILLSNLITLIVFVLGIVVFYRTEKNFLDTV